MNTNPTLTAAEDFAARLPDSHIDAGPDGWQEVRWHAGETTLAARFFIGGSVRLTIEGTAPYVLDAIVDALEAGQPQGPIPLNPERIAQVRARADRLDQRAAALDGTPGGQQPARLKRDEARRLRGRADVAESMLSAQTGQVQR